ncbi:MAG: phosphatase, partial [Burkholderiaceae bacterium]
MKFKKLSLAIAMALVGSSALADSSGFSHFTPLVGDTVAGSLPESAPFVLSSPDFSQINIATRDVTQATRFDSGNWDMHTVNENGRDAGRFLFTVYETGQAGIQRTDLRNMQTTTIWNSLAVSPALDSHKSFDASRWTPW